MSGVTADLLDAARSALIAHNLTISGTDHLAIRLPASAGDELIRALTRRADRVEQIVPYTGRPSDEDEFSRGVWRRHARAGHEVSRVYVVPYGASSPTTVEDEVGKDKISGINAFAYYTDGTKPSPVPMTNTWIIDDEVVVYQDHGDIGSPEWVVSGRDEEVKAARERWQQAWDLGREDPHPPPQVDEPLLESANMLYVTAQLACVGSQYIDDTSCGWYHGTWQYLRLFDLVSSPNWHAAFYAGELRKALRGRGRVRVLITGAADYGTLAQVLAAAADESPESLDIHVLDVCLTPLLANQWYARRHDVEITLHHTDFLCDAEDLSNELGAFDLIVSDAFLTRFTRPRALRVLHNWRQLLSPDGRLITTVRLHRRTPRESISQEVTGYLLRLYERAKNSHWLLNVEFDELRDAAREYAVRMRSSKELGNASQILARFRENDLTVIDHKQGEVAGELVRTDYLRIVAAAGSASADVDQISDGWR